jgi:polyphosphate kinase
LDTSLEKATSPEPVVDLESPRLFINRELSALQFQHRVLEEAMDEANPLLERVKFMAIVGSNFDEFFMVRVAGLKKQVDAGVMDLPPDGMTPAEQLAEIRRIATSMMKEASDYLRTKLIPDLKNAGIFVLDYRELNKQQAENVENYYREVIFPVLTPLAFDPGHPFPHISNLSLNLAVLLKDKKGINHFARIKVPNTLPRLVPIKRSSGGVRKDGTVPYNHYFVWLEQVISANLASLFPGMEVIESYPFRVVRDADMNIQELEAADLLETIEQTVRQRRFGTVVMITINETMSARIEEILTENLEIGHNEVYTIEGPMGYSDLWALHSIDRYDIKDLPFKPVVPRRLREINDGNIFSVIRDGDILLHHPYDSFSPVIQFLKTASEDPDVLAIKMTLYRVGSKPPVVDALLEAAENGKQVAVLVELKARFDEESNIGWARMLEKEGVHVVYGLLGLKTHSKIAMVIRKEGDGIRRYLHMSTGNYNAITAQVYEDIGMFTCDDDMGVDATDLFNYLTGYSSKKEYLKLLVAPINLRSRMASLIRREIDIQKSGGQGHLIFKINSLVDKKMIQLLYIASQAGVKIDLFVRGICCLRPGVPGVSDNIQIISIVGRFLEHSRIYYFHNAGNEEIYLGSADLMPRNIDRRVEVLFPVQDQQMIMHIRDNILNSYWKDNMKARKMQADGSYIRLTPQNDTEPISIQNWFISGRR